MGLRQNVFEGKTPELASPSSWPTVVRLQSSFFFLSDSPVDSSFVSEPIELVSWLLEISFFMRNGISRPVWLRLYSLVSSVCSCGLPCLSGSLMKEGLLRANRCRLPFTVKQDEGSLDLFVLLVIDAISLGVNETSGTGDSSLGGSISLDAVTCCFSVF